MLTPDKKKEPDRQVEVREVYKISKVGTVAGCRPRRCGQARLARARVRDTS